MGRGIGKGYMGVWVYGFEGRRVRRVYEYMGEEKERSGGGGSERGRLKEGEERKCVGSFFIVPIA